MLEVPGGKLPGTFGLFGGAFGLFSGPRSLVLGELLQLRRVLLEGPPVLRGLAQSKSPAHGVFGRLLRQEGLDHALEACDALFDR